jgi:Rad3-related DNA helicase
MEATSNLFPIIGQEETPAVTGTFYQATQPIKPSIQTNTDPDIRKHFPFPTMRDAQGQALDLVVRSAQEKKKFTLIEAPTGVGKSGIAIATGSWAKTQPITRPRDSQGSIILSTQKTLTAQYMKDFSQDGLVELKGRANYQCATHETDCASAAAFQDENDNCAKNGVCPYANAKEVFMGSPAGVTNFSYFLTETMYAGRLKPRNYLVLDECHNVENQILGFTDTEFTKEKAAELGITLPIFKAGAIGNTAAALKWFEEVATPKMNEYIGDLEMQIEQAKNDGEREEAVELAKRFQRWTTFKKRTDMFRETDRPGDWIVYSDVNEKGFGTKNLIIKPLTATLFAESIMFKKAANIVMMSATILDFKTFMRNLGIDSSQANTMSIPSEFPLENRPIFFKPVGNMSSKTKKDSLPLLAAYTEKLLSHPKYVGVKGIIHTHSYDITKYMMEYLTSRGFGDRLISHTNLPGSRDAAVAKHLASPHATILVSPSMTEGLDLKEELSRFQIILKVPYAYLDPYVNARMARDSAWYAWQTALTLVQATGRSVRSTTDKAHTWILDSEFQNFLLRNERIFPNWWLDSIQFKG